MTRWQTATVALIIAMSASVGGLAAAQEGGFWGFVREQSASAQFQVGAMYYSGTVVERDIAEAEKWWQRAAKQGSARALHNLGVIYHRGEGVAKNFRKAADFHRRAAEKGFVESQHNLGMLYYRGEGVRQNFHDAYVWFSLAAERGYAKSLPFRKDAADALSAKELTSAQATAARLRKDIRQKTGN